MKIIGKLTSMFFEWIMGSKDKNKCTCCCNNKETISFDDWLDFHYEKTDDESIYKIDRIYYNREDLLMQYNRIKHTL